MDDKQLNVIDSLTKEFIQNIKEINKRLTSMEINQNEINRRLTGLEAEEKMLKLETFDMRREILISIKDITKDIRKYLEISNKQINIVSDYLEKLNYK